MLGNSSKTKAIVRDCICMSRLQPNALQWRKSVKFNTYFVLFPTHYFTDLNFRPFYGPAQKPRSKR